MPKTDYQAAAPAETEGMTAVTLVYADGEISRYLVATSKRGQVAIEPGLIGEAEFVTLREKAKLTKEMLDAIWAAVPDMTDEQRGIAVAAPEAE